MILISNMSPKLTSEPYVSFHDILIVFDYLGRACSFNKEIGLSTDEYDAPITWTEWFSSGEAEDYFERIDQSII